MATSGDSTEHATGGGGTPRLIEPRLDLGGVKAKQAAPLDEGDPALADEAADVASLDPEPAGHGPDVPERPAVVRLVVAVVMVGPLSSSSASDRCRGGRQRDISFLAGDALCPSRDAWGHAGPWDCQPLAGAKLLRTDTGRVGHRDAPVPSG